MYLALASQKNNYALYMHGLADKTLIDRHRRDRRFDAGGAADRGRGQPDSLRGHGRFASNALTVGTRYHGAASLRTNTTSAGTLAPAIASSVS